MNYVIDLQTHNIMSILSEAYLKKIISFFPPHFSVLLFSLFLFQSTKEHSNIKA